MIEVKVTYYPPEGSGEEPISNSDRFMLNTPFFEKTIGFDISASALRSYDLLVANSEVLKKELQK